MREHRAGLEKGNRLNPFGYEQGFNLIGLRLDLTVTLIASTSPQLQAIEGGSTGQSLAAVRWLGPSLTGDTGLARQQGMHRVNNLGQYFL